MRVRSLGFGTDLMVRRLAGSRIADRGDHLVVRTPANPTFWWGNFLLFPNPPGRGDAERWAALFAKAFPEAGHRAYGVDGPTGEVGEEAEIAALGVRPEVSTVLTASVLAEPPRPTASIRRLHGNADWAAALRLHLACEGDSGDAADPLFVERRLDEARRLTQRGHGAWLGAFEQERMISSLGVFTDGFGLARYQNVMTHPAHRRRGLARRLLYEAACLARTEFGVRTLVIVADPDYHAVAIYRGLGFEPVERQVQLAGGKL